MAEQELTLRQTMNRIYKDICGYEIPKSDINAIKKSKGSPVYGEINHAAVNKLIEYLQMTKKDTFVDLGSGVGKIVLQMVLSTEIKKGVGVELSKLRYEESLRALENAIELRPDLKRRCQFVNENLMNYDLSDASVIYSCSTAFSQSFMREISHMLGDYTHKFKLVTLQNLPNEKFFHHTETLKLDMSWTRATQVYIYERK